MLIHQHSLSLPTVYTTWTVNFFVLDGRWTKTSWCTHWYYD